ncbi:MAG: RNA 2'-phosphotransferase [bacterium]|nr:RNA 2'-phosphotransferase [bacterium]
MEEFEEQEAYKFIRNTSKLLNILLRHKPEQAHLELDRNGWTDVRQMISKVSRSHYPIDFELVKHIVFTNDKRRFMFNEDLTKIRATPGDGVVFDLGLLPVVPPEFLYYGASAMFLDDIAKWGINKMNKQYVHLSPDADTAMTAAAKRIGPVPLKIAALEMYENQILFYQSDFDVWLTDHVPSQYVSME